MARAFRPVGNSYVAELDEAEAKLVARLALDVKEMLETRAELTGDLHPGEGPDDGGAAPAGDGAPWWEELGLSPADLGVGPDGELLPDNEALPGAAAPGTGEEAPRRTTRRRARPADPALARLLPDLVAEGEAADGEAERLRALTEPGLVAAKRANLAEAADLLSMDPLRVPAARAAGFASALNDIRLVLAQRLGIQTAEDAARVAAAEEDPGDELEHYLALLYGFVSWLQESLMTALLRRKH